MILRMLTFVGHGNVAKVGRWMRVRRMEGELVYIFDLALLRVIRVVIGQQSTANIKGLARLMMIKVLALLLFKSDIWPP